MEHVWLLMVDEHVGELKLLIIMKTVSFFLRNYATIDHHAPYIYYLNKSNKCHVELLLTDINYEYEKNEFIKFFLIDKKINIINIPNEFKKKFKYFSFFVSFIKYIINLLPRFIYLKVLNRIKKEQKKKFGIFYRDYISLHIKKNMNGIFDYSESKNINYAKSLINKYNGKTINLAHWVWMWHNVLRLDNMMELHDKSEKIGSFRNFDHCIVDNKIALEKFQKAGLKKKYTHLLGSIRFTKEWIKIRDRLIPINKVKSDGHKKIKALLFFPKLGQNIHTEELKRAIIILSREKEIEIIFKIHDSVEKYFVEKHIPAKILEQSNLKIITNEYSSRDLIEWSDIVFNVHSTVMFEALINNKTCVVLNYLHSNRMWFECEPGYWKINTRDDLLLCIKNIIKKKNYRPYNEKEKNALVNKVNLVRKDIVQKYVELAIK